MQRSEMQKVGVLLVACLLWLQTSRASAYYWMVRHGYTTCATCHADPSGGSLLTEYGRAQGELVMKTHYRAKDAEDPGPGAHFLFGALKLPANLLLGGDLRGFVYDVIPKTGNSRTDIFLMQSDVQGQISFGRFRANASLGYAQKGASAAAITNWAANNVVSRVHWLGVDLGSGKEFLLRGGRMNLPFGIRTIEHTMFVRSATRTDINAAQSHGISLAYNSGRWRSELMALLGNYQISPDRFRERGYSGYIEYAWTPTLATGLSSLGGYSKKDPRYQASLFRQAHGVFVRYAPIQAIVLSTEVDLLIDSVGDVETTGMQADTHSGVAALLQADYEPIQGLHFIGIGETLARSNDSGASYSAWGAIAWFFYSHLDVRFDTVYQSFVVGPGRTHATSILGQLHGYL